MPSKGADIGEAKEIVRKGPIIWHLKKMQSDIENWTFEDHDEFIKCLNWRSRLFFDAKNRVWNRVKVLQEAHWNTGKQPAELGEQQIKKLLKPLKDKWYESVVISPHGWNALLGGGIIIFAIFYLNLA